MGATTGIEWTDATWNPIRGCSRVSEGCRNCYAEAVAYRFSGKRQPYEGLAVLKNGHASWTGKVEFIEKHLLDPLKWKPGRPIYDAAVVDLDGKPKRVGRDAGQSLRIFVNSMSDLFHENVTDEQRDKIFAVMALCPQHTFQILTKRPERMQAYFSGLRDDPDAVRRAVEVANFAHATLRRAPRDDEFDALIAIATGLPNVWLGVSVENQKTADERIPLLLQTSAAVRFISAEPLLGELDLFYVEREATDEDRRMPGFGDCAAFYLDALWGCHSVAGKDCSAVYEEQRGMRPHLDWVICGGESGPGARPMHPDWARSLRDQCAAAGVPFFFKQWGEFVWRETFGDSTGCHKAIFADGVFVERVGKKSAGALLDGVEHKAFPAVQPCQ